MKKILLIICVLTGMVFQVKSGGLVTNSNQSASYYRMLARGASTSGDAVYYNPAGLAFLDQGLTVSLNTQMIWMQRTITNDLPTFAYRDPALKNNEFIGTLYVPVFPGIYAAYKTGNWTFSLGFNPPAGGGSVEFADGLPMLEKDVSFIPSMLTAQGEEMAPGSGLLRTTKYSMQSMMKGTSIVYGIQAGASYSINEMIGVFGGIRMSFASNSYEGYVKDIMINPVHPLVNPTGSMMSAPGFFTAINNPVYAAATNDQSLDVTQKGSGIAPILGLHFRLNSLNLAAKYEFSTTIKLKNETKSNAMNMYPDGMELRSDVPALLSLAGSYDIFPALRLSVTYLHHFEPQATIESWAPNATQPAGGTTVKRQDLIDKGTNEFMAGLEYKLFNKLVLSTGCQLSKVGVKEDWQNDITHNLDNFTMGLGAAYHFGERLTLNIGGLYTWYTPSEVKGVANTIPFTQTYDRSNKAIALGIDYRF